MGAYDRNPFLYTIEGEDPEFVLEQMDTASEILFAGFQPTDNILIKINTNSPLPYPASTSGQFLKFFLKLLHRNGFHQLAVGDCSSNSYLPTRSVFKKLGFDRIITGEANVLAFEEEPYVEVALDGEYLKSVRLSKHAYTFDRIINLTNMKTHCLADYSLAMKNLIGFLHPLDRKALHESHLREKIAEITLGIRPDLNIVDARLFFITGGPDEGDVARGNTVFVSNDLLKIDIEAYRRLYEWKRETGITVNFLEEPADMPQISHYIRMHQQ
jgi:uncharacterized protein (DUF362 family)